MKNLKLRWMRAIFSGAVLAAAGAAATSCGVDQEIHDAALKDLALQKQKRGEAEAAAAQEKTSKETRDAKILVLQQQNDALTKRLEGLGQDVSRLQTERGTLEGDLDSARKRMEELKKAQAAAEARAAQFRKLVAQFKQMTDSGKLQVEVRENRMIVRLGDQILFDPGKTLLKKEGQEALKQVTVVLKDIPNRNFQVAGHTDNVPIKTGKFRSNWDLSAARAVEVVNFMIASGMEAKRLSAAGYAAESPVAANDSPENMAKNRRIEITLVPNLDDLPPIGDALKETPGGGAP